MIRVELAGRLQQMAADLTLGGDDLTVSIISGYRTPEQQEALRQAGRPAAHPDRSTHLACPATGADLRLSVTPTTAIKARFGQAAIRAGLRWGGGSPVDDNGIPSDWNHVDLGPRR